MRLQQLKDLKYFVLAEHAAAQAYTVHTLPISCASILKPQRLHLGTMTRPLGLEIVSCDGGSEHWQFAFPG